MANEFWDNSVCSTDVVPEYEFRLFVDRYHGHYKVKSFSCWDQFLCLAFAPLTYRESLRDIETCLEFSTALDAPNILSDLESLLRQSRKKKNRR